MPTLELPAPPVPASAVDELFALQLKVARRADELARGGDSTRGRDLQLWFQAEREIMPPAAAPEREEFVREV